MQAVKVIPSCQDAELDGASIERALGRLAERARFFDRGISGGTGMMHNPNLSLATNNQEPELLRLCQAHAREPDNTTAQQALLHALYPAILPLLEHAARTSGFGTRYLDEILDRIRVRALQQHFLLRNDRFTALLNGPVPCEEELTALLLRIILTLARWETATLRRAWRRSESLEQSLAGNGDADLNFESEYLAHLDPELSWRDLCDAVTEALHDLKLTAEQKRILQLSLSGATQLQIASQAGCNQATVSRHLKRLKPQLALEVRRQLGHRSPQP